MMVDKEDGNASITLLIILATIGLIIMGAAILSSYGLGQVAAQKEGNSNNNNTKLSPAILRQQAVAQAMKQIMTSYMIPEEQSEIMSH